MTFLEFNIEVEGSFDVICFRKALPASLLSASLFGCQHLEKLNTRLINLFLCGGIVLAVSSICQDFISDGFEITRGR